MLSILFTDSRMLIGDIKDLREEFSRSYGDAHLDFRLDMRLGLVRLLSSPFGISIVMWGTDLVDLDEEEEEEADWEGTFFELCEDSSCEGMDRIESPQKRTFVGICAMAFAALSSPAGITVSLRGILSCIEDVASMTC